MTEFHYDRLDRLIDVVHAGLPVEFVRLHGRLDEDEETLLRTVATLRPVPAVASSEVKARVWQRIAEGLDQPANVEPAAVKHLPDPWWRRPLVAVAASIVLFTVGSTMAAQSAKAALPGDLLFPMRITIEDVEVTIAAADEKAAIEMAQAIRSATDMRRAAEAGRAEAVEILANRYVEKAQSATRHFREVKGSDLVELPGLELDSVAQGDAPPSPATAEVDDDSAPSVIVVPTEAPAALAPVKPDPTVVVSLPGPTTVTTPAVTEEPGEKDKPDRPGDHRRSEQVKPDRPKVSDDNPVPRRPDKPEPPLPAPAQAARAEHPKSDLPDSIPAAKRRGGDSAETSKPEGPPPQPPALPAEVAPPKPERPAPAAVPSNSGQPGKGASGGAKK